MGLQPPERLPRTRLHSQGHRVVGRALPVSSLSAPRHPHPIFAFSPQLPSTTAPTPRASPHPALRPPRTRGRTGPSPRLPRARMHHLPSRPPRRPRTGPSVFPSGDPSVSGDFWVSHPLPAQGHCPGTPLPVSVSETLGPVPRSHRSRLRTLRALCRWPPRTQKMPDGAPANPKGCRKKGLVRQTPGRRGPSLRTSSRSIHDYWKKPQL